MKQLREERDLATRDWLENNDYIHDASSLEMLAFTPNLVPFSIFPFPPRLCVDLLIGAKAYLVLLNINAVEREFQYRGWKIKKTFREIAQSNEARDAFLEVERDGFYCTIPPGDFMRLQMELLRPQVLIQQCEEIKSAGPGGLKHDFGFFVYEHERDLWDKALQNSTA
jgi:hypothetical protein